MGSDVPALRPQGPAVGGLGAAHATWGTYMTCQHETHEAKASTEHDWNTMHLPGIVCPYHQGMLRAMSSRVCFLQRTLSTAVLSLTLILTIMVGCLYAQVPQSSSELAPAPTAPGPLETLPSPQEQLLAPVPQQFNWLEREVPSNPFLESLLSLRAPRGLDGVDVAYGRRVR